MYQLMTGEPVSAQDAFRMGMVVRLCPPAELMNIALEIAEKIARSGPTALANSVSPTANPCRTGISWA